MDGGHNKHNADRREAPIATRHAAASPKKLKPAQRVFKSQRNNARFSRWKLTWAASLLRWNNALAARFES
jgi:hypothetical protein